MSSEIFNPNPTVFTTSRSKSTHAFCKGNSLWLDNHDDEPLDFEDSQEVLEEIDQDEVFGSGSLSFSLRMILLNVL